MEQVRIEPYPWQLSQREQRRLKTLQEQQKWLQEYWVTPQDYAELPVGQRFGRRTAEWFLGAPASVISTLLPLPTSWEKQMYAAPRLGKLPPLTPEAAQRMQEAITPELTTLMEQQQAYESSNLILANLLMHAITGAPLVGEGVLRDHVAPTVGASWGAFTKPQQDWLLGQMDSISQMTPAEAYRLLLELTEEQDMPYPDEVMSPEFWEKFDDRLIRTGVAWAKDQETIVSALNEIFGLTEGERQRLEQYDQIGAGALEDWFSGKRTLDEILASDELDGEQKTEISDWFHEAFGGNLEAAESIAMQEGNVDKFWEAYATWLDEQIADAEDTVNQMLELNPGLSREELMSMLVLPLADWEVPPEGLIMPMVGEDGTLYSATLKPGRTRMLWGEDVLHVYIDVDGREQYIGDIDPETEEFKPQRDTALGGPGAVVSSLLELVRPYMPTSLLPSILGSLVARLPGGPDLEKVTPEQAQMLRERTDLSRAAVAMDTFAERIAEAEALIEAHPEEVPEIFKLANDELQEYLHTKQVDRILQRWEEDTPWYLKAPISMALDFPVYYLGLRAWGTTPAGKTFEAAAERALIKMLGNKYTMHLSHRFGDLSSAWKRTRLGATSLHKLKGTALYKATTSHQDRVLADAYFQLYKNTIRYTTDPVTRQANVAYLYNVLYRYPVGKAPYVPKAPIPAVQPTAADWSSQLLVRNLRVSPAVQQSTRQLYMKHFSQPYVYREIATRTGKILVPERPDQTLSQLRASSFDSITQPLMRQYGWEAVSEFSMAGGRITPRVIRAVNAYATRVGDTALADTTAKTLAELAKHPALSAQKGALTRGIAAQIRGDLIKAYDYLGAPTEAAIASRALYLTEKMFPMYQQLSKALAGASASTIAAVTNAVPDLLMEMERTSIDAAALAHYIPEDVVLEKTDMLAFLLSRFGYDHTAIEEMSSIEAWAALISLPDASIPPLPDRFPVFQPPAVPAEVREYVEAITEYINTEAALTPLEQKSLMMGRAIHFLTEASKGSHPVVQFYVIELARQIMEGELTGLPEILPAVQAMGEKVAGADISFEATVGMKEQLSTFGFSEEEINSMSPSEAWTEILYYSIPPEILGITEADYEGQALIFNPDSGVAGEWTVSGYSVKEVISLPDEMRVGVQEALKIAARYNEMVHGTAITLGIPGKPVITPKSIEMPLIETRYVTQYMEELGRLLSPEEMGQLTAHFTEDTIVLLKFLFSRLAQAKGLSVRDAAMPSVEALRELSRAVPQVGLPEAPIVTEKLIAEPAVEGIPMPPEVRADIISRAQAWLEQMPSVPPKEILTTGIPDGEGFVITGAASQMILAGTFLMREGQLTLSTVVSVSPGAPESAVSVKKLFRYMKDRDIAFPPREEMSPEALRLYDRLVAKDVAPAVLTAPAVAETGSPYTATVFKGKTEVPTDEGLYGVGKYYATDKEYALTYGPVTQYIVSLQNPYVIKSHEEAEAFWNHTTRPAREAAIREGKTPQEADVLGAQAATKWLKDRGHDGVIARDIVAKGDEVMVLDPAQSIAEALAVPPTAPAVEPAALAGSFWNLAPAPIRDILGANLGIKGARDKAWEQLIRADQDKLIDAFRFVSPSDGELAMEAPLPESAMNELKSMPDDQWKPFGYVDPDKLLGTTAEEAAKIIDAQLHGYAPADILGKGFALYSRYRDWQGYVNQLERVFTKPGKPTAATPEFMSAINEHKFDNVGQGFLMNPNWFYYAAGGGVIKDNPGLQYLLRPMELASMSSDMAKVFLQQEFHDIMEASPIAKAGLERYGDKWDRAITEALEKYTSHTALLQTPSALVYPPEVVAQLKKMPGYKPGDEPELLRLLAELRTMLDRWRADTNVVRKLMGQKEIPYREGYVSQILKETAAYRLLGIDPKVWRDYKDTGVIPDYIEISAVFDPFAQPRSEKIPQHMKERRLSKIINKYAAAMAADRFLTPAMKYAVAQNKVLEAHGYHRLAQSHGDIANGLLLNMPGGVDRWIKEHGGFVGNIGLNVLQRQREFLTLSVFPLNFSWNVVVQPSSLALNARYGPVNCVKGVIKWLTDPEFRKMMIAEFTPFYKREVSVVFQDIDKIIVQGELLGSKKLYSAVDAMSFVVKHEEWILTGISMAAAWFHGQEKGLTGDALRHYASVGAAQTQSIYMRSMQSSLFRNQAIRSMFPFQTFIIDAYNNMREWVGASIWKMAKREPPPFFKVGAWRDRATNVGDLLRQLFIFLMLAHIFNTIGDTVSGRKPWEVRSWLPMEAQLRFMMNPYGAPIWAQPLALQQAMEFRIAIQTLVDPEVPDDYRYEPLRKFFLRYFTPGGTAAERAIDAWIAESRGAVTNRKGEELFEMVDKSEDMEAFIHSMLFGVYSTQEGREYVKRLREGGEYVPDLHRTADQIDERVAVLGEVLTKDNAPFDLKREIGKVYTTSMFSSDMQGYADNLGIEVVSSELMGFHELASFWHACKDDLEFYEETDTALRKTLRYNRPQLDAILFFWGKVDTVLSEDAEMWAALLLDYWDLPPEAIPSVARDAQKWSELRSYWRRYRQYTMP